MGNTFFFLGGLKEIPGRIWRLRTQVHSWICGGVHPLLRERSFLGLAGRDYWPRIQRFSSHTEWTLFFLGTFLHIFCGFCIKTWRRWV